MRCALVFPGQGSQRPGMGEPWASTPGWALVGQASHALDRDLAALLLDAPAEELRRPAEAQVSTFLTSLLALEALHAGGALDAADVVAVAGHSLGEYTALVAAGALDVEAGLALVAERGAAMSAAAAARPGTMAAVLGLAIDGVHEACGAARNGGAEVWVANDNAPRHVVISGTDAGVEAGGSAARERGARRVLPLPVGGAFHTPLMEPARERLARAIAATSFADARLPVISNVDAAPHRTAADWPELLERQLTAPVLWRSTLDRLGADGVELVVEIGPGGVLTGLTKRAGNDARGITVNRPEDVEALGSALAVAA